MDTRCGGLVVGTKDFEVAHARAKSNAEFFLSTEDKRDKLYHCGILWRFERCVHMNQRMILCSRSENEDEVCADGEKWMTGVHASSMAFAGGVVSLDSTLGKDTFANDISGGDLLRDMERGYSKKMIALSRSDDGVIDLIDPAKVKASMSGGDISIDQLERQSDGVVHLLAFGSERILVNDKGMIPSRIVEEGREKAISELALDFLGLVGRQGIKLYGEYVGKGTVNFVYIIPVQQCPRVGFHKWKALNQVLESEDPQPLQFVLGLFPRCRMLAIHYANLVDYGMLEIQREALESIEVTAIQLIRAMLSSGPKKLKAVERWMVMLGRDKGAVEIARELKKSTSGIKIRNDDSDELQLDMRYYHNLMGWPEDFNDLATVSPQEKDPYPLVKVCEIVNMCPMSFVEDERIKVSYVVDVVDPTITRACVHGACCDEYCRGPCHSHVCKKEELRGPWKNTDGTSDNFRFVANW